MSFDIFGEFDLGIIFWRVANHFAGISNAPESARVVGYTVENLERDTVFVADILRLNRLRVELLHVCGGDKLGHRSAG